MLPIVVTFSGSSPMANPWGRRTEGSLSGREALAEALCRCEESFVVPKVKPFSMLWTRNH
jgi:hypothetical protein